jgi:preprotein translocase subunit SecF
MVDFFRNKDWDLVGRRNLWFAISAVTILLGLVFWRLHGLNYGIDFTGGGLLSYKLSRPVAARDQAATLEQARQRLKDVGITQAQIQIAGSAAARGKDQLLIRTRIPPGEDERRALDEQKTKINSTLQARFPGIKPLGADIVTGVVSAELKNKATLALIIGSILVLIYITLRYDYRFAVAAIVALVHDMLVLTGWFAIFQKEVNTPFVAALLTVVGYSVHDTIVIFDRIRENVRLKRAPTFAETANRSLLETMARSVNTVLTVEFVLLALLVLGGASMRAFAEALLVGITTGAYSSIFNASQIVVVWKQREERKRGLLPAAGRGATAGRAARVSTPPAPRPAPTPQPARSASTLSSDAASSSEEEAEPRARLPRSQRKKLKGKKRKRRF